MSSVLSNEQRVEALLVKMTLEEKIGQMTQVGALQDEHVDLIRSGAVSSSDRKSVV